MDTFQVPVEFRALLRGLAACHLVNSQVQFHGLSHLDPGDERVLKAKEVLDEAKRFNCAMNPKSPEAQLSPSAAA